MKKKISAKEIAVAQDDMRPEYDFTRGVRGKHFKARQKGYAIKIHKADGTTTVKHIKREPLIKLAPDVKEHFPDSRAVNRALRALITLFPAKGKGAGSKSGIRLERSLAPRRRSKKSLRA